jgi:sigma-B regulation protein RsbU (phosphoserine phosphatase)
LVSGILRSLARDEPYPADMLNAINRSLMHRRLDAQYLVLTCALWDDEKHTLRVANSGNPRPIYCHQGHAHMLEAAGLPLGMFEDVSHDEVTIHAKPGDVFAFFSDGIVDASNSKDEPFGRGRVEHVIAKHAGGTAREIVDAIFKATEEFAAGTEVFDDQTAVVLKVK